MTHTFESLTTTSFRDLCRIHDEGTTPRFSDLVGFEWRGFNVFGNAIASAVGRVMGIRRFAKGFFTRDAAMDDAAAVNALPFIEGYNIPIQRGTTLDPWTAIPDDAHLRRFAFFRIFGAHAGDCRKGRHPQALFLHYDLGDPRPGLFEGRAVVGDGGLKDYMVHPGGDPNLLVGLAYYDLGPISNANVFVAERLRRADFTPAARTRS